MIDAAPVDETRFKEAMAGVCAPVTVVTAMKRDAPRGATVSAMASVSLNPPLVSVALHERSELLAVIRSFSRLGINVLGAGADDLALRFAGPRDRRFDQVEWELVDDVPMLHRAPSFLSCAVDHLLDAGDHVVVIARVLRIIHRAAAPLVYGHRRFGTHSAFVSDWPAPRT